MRLSFFQRLIIALSGALTLGLSIITPLAMVVAPHCTGIPQKSAIYQIGSAILFPVAFYFLAWRRESIIAAVVIPVAQIALGIAFLNYISSLPLGCPQ